MPTSSRRLPFPASEEELTRIMKDRRYWDERHPEFQTYQRVVREGFQRLFSGPLRYDARGAIVEAPRPEPAKRPPFIYAPEESKSENMGDGLARAATSGPGGTAGGSVHVRAYTRIQDGETVQVSEHDRAQPHGSGGSGGKNGDSPQEAENHDDLPPMVNPVPGGHMRGDDGPPYGAGHFKARRVGPDGKVYEHKGTDVAAEAGETVVSPISGVVEHVGDPYDAKKHPNKANIYQSVTILTEDGHRIKIFYVELDPSIGKDTPVSAGQRIGAVQDLSKIYPPKGGGRMTNHIHVEIWKNGRPKNPTGAVFGPSSE